MAKSKELLKRVLVAVVAVPLLIYLFYLGGLFFGALIALISLVAYYEFLSKTLPKDSGYIRLYAMVFSLIYQTVQMILIFNEEPVSFSSLLLMASLLVILIMICVPVFLFIGDRKEKMLKHLGMMVLGFFYTQALFSFLIIIRQIGSPVNGFYFVLFIFCIIWLNDTGAYFGGKALGKHKLAPKLSPHKTVEGFLISIVISLAASVIFNILFAFPGSLLQALIFGFIVSVFAMYGDLIESGFKRSLGIKDFGKILPGHGGVLDRFDSVIIVSPVLFLYYLTLSILDIQVIQ